MRKLKTPQNIVDSIVRLKVAGKSSRDIAEELLGSRSKKSTVNDIYNMWLNGSIESSIDMKDTSNLPKVLVLDVESAPLISAMWSMWQKGFGLNQLQNDWFLLSAAAKWLGNDNIYYEDMRGKVATEDDTHILDMLWKLLDEADILLTQNGIRFDLPKIKARMVMMGYKPFSPVKHIDTLQIAKKEFGFTSNKLEYMTDKLCTVHKKQKHQKFPGFELWAEMLKDNVEAFDECEEYNVDDILSLEELYLKLAAWDSKHVNFNLYTSENEHVCRCGSKSVVEDGYAYTGVSKFQRYRCLDCGATTRGRTNLFSKEKRKSLHMNIRD